jgi:hypothetical protein
MPPLALVSPLGDAWLPPLTSLEIANRFLMTHVPSNHWNKNATKNMRGELWISAARIWATACWRHHWPCWLICLRPQEYKKQKVPGSLLQAVSGAIKGTLGKKRSP